MLLQNIGLHNLNQAGLDALQFSLFGMALVFCGLLIIALYITLLPKLLDISKGKPQSKGKRSATEKEGESKEEILLAIATALHLYRNFPDGEERITWKSHGDMESPWLVSGRMHSLNARKISDTWNQR